MSSFVSSSRWDMSSWPCVFHPGLRWASRAQETVCPAQKTVFSFPHFFPGTLDRAVVSELLAFLWALCLDRHEVFARVVHEPIPGGKVPAVSLLPVTVLVPQKHRDIIEKSPGSQRPQVPIPASVAVFPPLQPKDPLSLCPLSLCPSAQKQTRRCPRLCSWLLLTLHRVGLLLSMSGFRSQAVSLEFLP